MRFQITPATFIATRRFDGTLVSAKPAPDAPGPFRVLAEVLLVGDVREVTVDEAASAFDAARIVASMPGLFPRVSPDSAIRFYVNAA